MDFKKEFFRFFKYWPVFIICLLVSIVSAYYYLEIVPPTYATTALINIDKSKEKDSQIVTTINLQNDKEVGLEEEKILMTSNNFLAKIVRDLKLNISYFEKGYFQNRAIDDAPFIVMPSISNDSLPQKLYDVKIVKEGFMVYDQVTEKRYLLHGHRKSRVIKNLPFTIELKEEAKNQISSFENKDFVVGIESTEMAVKELKATIGIEAFEAPNNNLFLSYKGTNPALSTKILKTLISELDKTIVINKQKTFKMTVAFLNKRIGVFAKEKDSIQSVKESYLKDNNIYVMEDYIASKSSEKSLTSATSALNQRQVALTRAALNDVKRSGNNKALGTDYNIDAPSVNQQLVNYNASLVQSEILLQRAGKNNPAYVSLAAQLKVQKEAIINSLTDYLNFLSQNSAVSNAERNSAISAARSIPTKDKELGNINNNLDLKEETYLSLLQKKEETLLNGAVLESNLSILDSPQTNYSDTFPKRKTFLMGAILFGLILAFGIAYLSLMMDSKIHTEEDITGDSNEIPFLGTIPKIDVQEKLDNSATSRSVIAEATRTLFSNISYLLPSKVMNNGNVVLFCSSIQGEGKSFCAFHNAITISNLNKKVLLIGADLRNPQLHEYFNVEKEIPGLTNFLSNNSANWKKFLIKEAKFSENLDVLFSGEIPPNPTQLLTNSNFELLLEEAKQNYDFIIIDSAPVQLVSDTFNFSALADVTVYVTRSNYSDKKTVAQLANFIKKGQLKNVGIVINGMKRNMGYGYDYAYTYKDDRAKKSWFKRS
ncbi:exopolysaccharide transport family protein [Flavobacterium algicola]|uniref:exopolysaccharide transport family protein n=1 Tax=Flavobacterium algicola TaxID=556529 RepID=UPI001EFE2696|nr:polysaccharide biosynthesis tyrosine autokinase [Flavobacterium algicola]MCG9793530.1 polysaccharide biosynthesis tyrosine autokinase [Flavobacterium algicola]